MLYEQIQDKLSNPSPFTWINVFNSSSTNNGQRDIKVIVDTGAGITSLPQSVIDNLGPLTYTVIKVRSPLEKDKNKVFFKKLYKVRLEFLELQNTDEQSHEIEVIGIPKDYGIIGRDVLHRYKIVLDSKKEQWGFDCRWTDGKTCDGDNCILPVSSQNL
jgi:hypothetical protein